MPEPIRLPTYNSLVHFWSERVGPGIRMPALAKVTRVYSEVESQQYSRLRSPGPPGLPAVDLDIELADGTTLVKRKVQWDASTDSGADRAYWKWPQERLK